LSGTELLIGGELVPGEGDAFEVENPYTTEPILTLPAASAEQVDAAVDAARAAFPAWSTTPAGERCDALHEVARRLRENGEELARTMTLEGGKPLIENRDEIDWCAAAFDYYAEIGRDSAGRVIPPIESSQLALVVKDPLGVVGCIVPWNYPLLLLCWKVAPALAAGNAVVCKPSEVTPLSTLALARCFEHLPDGVVNLIAGAGDVGAAISAHPDVDCVAFTGSVATGKRVAAACAERLARVNLEMGGKDPFIVCADVASEIEIAARRGAWAAFLNAGQVCTSAERFYVMKDVYDDYVSAFVEHTRGLVLGDPMEAATDIGPMVSAPQRQKVVDQVEAAVAAGAEVLVGGGTGGQGRGHFYAPAVVTGAPAETDLLREETFGPVAPIVPVADLDEAIALANGTRFGLGANVYTRDLKSAVRCMRELRAGTVWINDPLTDNDAGPFGGFKRSGLGRELGQEGLDAFQETKHVHIETKLEIKDWWYPYGGGDAPPHGA
jgi:betaine-aldehyde dehydrogenase